MRSSGLRSSELAGARPAADGLGGYPALAAPRPAPPPRRPRPSALPGLQPGGLRHEPHGPPPPGPPAQSGKEHPPGGSRGAAPWPGAEGRGLSTLSNLQKKKKKPKVLQWARAANHQVPQVPDERPAGARHQHQVAPARRGRNTPHKPAFLACSRSSLQGVLISGVKFHCSLVEIKGPSHLAFKSGLSRHSKASRDAWAPGGRLSYYPHL